VYHAYRAEEHTAKALVIGKQLPSVLLSTALHIRLCSCVRHMPAGSVCNKNGCSSLNPSMLEHVSSAYATGSECNKAHSSLNPSLVERVCLAHATGSLCNKDGL